jgi:hypothetical protein
MHRQEDIRLARRFGHGAAGGDVQAERLLHDGRGPMLDRAFDQLPMRGDLGDDVDQPEALFAEHRFGIRVPVRYVEFRRGRFRLALVEVTHRSDLDAARPEIAPRVEMVLREETASDDSDPGRGRHAGFSSIDSGWSRGISPRGAPASA